MNSIFPPFLFRYFEQCVIGQNCETQNRLQKSVFTHVASNYSNLLEQKKRVYRRKEFNSQTIGLEHKHGRPFNVLGHQHGGHDVSIAIMLCSLAQTIILRIRFW